MWNRDEFIEIVKSIMTCPHITDFPEFKNSGHPKNRVITCREDIRKQELNYPDDATVLAIFIPGVCVYIHPDGTWSYSPSGDE